MSVFKENQVNPDQVIEVKKEQKLKQELVASKKISRGHTLYEVNTVEQTINVVEFEDQVVSFKNQASKPKSKGIGILNHQNGTKKVVVGQLEPQRKVLIKKKDCIYISALNRKNLMKKLVKRGIIKIVKK